MSERTAVKVQNTKAQSGYSYRQINLRIGTIFSSRVEKDRLCSANQRPRRLLTVVTGRSDFKTALPQQDPIEHARRYGNLSLTGL